MRRQRPKGKVLDHLYHELELSLDQLSEAYQRSKSTILRWMRQEGVGRRSPGRPSECPECEELAEVYQHFRQRVARVADHYDKTEKTVRKWLRECDLAPDAARRPSGSGAAGRAWQAAAAVDAPRTTIVSTRPRKAR